MSEVHHRKLETMYRDAPINALYEPGMLEQLRQRVQPPQTAETWDAYVAAVEKAIS